MATDTPDLPASPKKDIGRPLQAGDHALTRADRDAADDLARVSRNTDASGRPLTNRPARTQNLLRDEMAAGGLTATSARKIAGGSMLRSMKGRR